MEINKGKKTIVSLVKKLNSSEESMAIWDIVTSLRGPDFSSSEVIKRLTTARLRAIIGIELRLCNINSVPLTKEEVIYRNVFLRKHNQHFRYHFQEAMVSLKHMGYPVPKQELDFWSGTDPRHTP